MDGICQIFHSTQFLQPQKRVLKSFVKLSKYIAPGRVNFCVLLMLFDLANTHQPILHQANGLFCFSGPLPFRFVCCFIFSSLFVFLHIVLTVFLYLVSNSCQESWTTEYISINVQMRHQMAGERSILYCFYPFGNCYLLLFFSLCIASAPRVLFCKFSFACFCLRRTRVA